MMSAAAIRTSTWRQTDFFGRSWTIGLVTASWINGSAWLFLAFESRGKDWVDPGVYTAYGFLTAAAAAGLLVPVMWGIQKAKKDPFGSDGALQCG